MRTDAAHDPILRSPAGPGDLVASYPTLSAHSEARRRFLKLCALGSASAMLGMQLTGCPGGTGGSGGGGQGPDWVPWDGPERLAGEVAMPVGAPVAVVAGGGPIGVTFKDGSTAQLVVAATVTPVVNVNVAADFTKLNAAHVKIVQAEAAKVPQSTLTRAEDLQKLEANLHDALNGSFTNGYVDAVSVARAEEAAPVAPRQAPPAREEARAEESADVAREMEEVAAAPAPAAPELKRAPKVRKLWTACRRAGCTTCGAR